MNNLIVLQKFFKNKNTVTILGVIAIIIVLFFGYRYQIKSQVNPVSGIPVASQTIQPRTKITREMIDYVDVAPIVLQSNVIRKAQEVIGRYSNYNTVIPQGSMFYQGTVVKESDLPDSAFVDVAEGEVPYNFPVNIETTYGNSIYPGNYIDIYMKGENESGVLMVGKLVENVKVLAVKDASGRHVFENSDESRTPAFLIFGLTPQINILLRKASYMSSYSVELFPVPHGVTITEPDSTYVTSKTLEDFINAHTVANDELINQTDTSTDQNISGSATPTNPAGTKPSTGR